MCVAVPILPGLDPFASAVWLPAAVAAALLVAWPAAVIAHAIGLRGIVAAVAAGALLGVVPFGLLALASPLMIVLMVVMGAVGASITWGLQRILAWPDRWLSAATAQVVGTLTLILTAAATFEATHLAVRLMAGPRDESCHNTMRDGRKSIGPVANASLDIPEDEWPRLRSMLAAEARGGGWAIRDYSHATEHSSRVAVSLCREPGTVLMVDELKFRDRPSPIPGVSVIVFQPQGGDEWTALTRGFYRQVSATWPGKLTFKDGNGRVSPAPDWYCASIRGLPEDSVLCRVGHSGSTSREVAPPLP
ncbi:MAG: hypothetical protein AB1942_19460 [Pseudomonadota bacterium]